MHENECTWLMVCWWWYEWIQYKNLTYCVVPVTCSMTNLLLCKSLLSGCHLNYSLTICLLNKFVLPISSWYSSEPNSSMSRISLNLAWSWAFLSVLFCSLRCFLGLSNLLQMLNHDITFAVVLWKITNLRVHVILYRRWINLNFMNWRQTVFQNYSTIIHFWKMSAHHFASE